MESPRLYKVCDNERQAREYQQIQEDLLRNKNLHHLFEVEVEPLSRTKDNYVNGLGPWGVYLHNRISD